MSTNEPPTDQSGQFDPFAPTTVTAVQRFGYHAQPTRLVLTFGAGLDPARAENVENYTIIGPQGGSLAG